MQNTSTQELLQRLQKAQSLIQNLQENLRKAEAVRDTLIRQLSDHQGCSDQRFAVR